MEKSDAMSDTTNTDATSDATKITSTDETFPEGLAESGRTAIKAERDARKAAERAAKETATELETLRREKAEAAAAKAAADEADAAEKGQYKTLAEKRAEELKAVQADKDSTAKELERATKHLQSVIDAKVKELKETEDADLIAGFPKDAPLLDQIDWLDDPRTKAAIKAASKTEPKRVPGGVTPRPNGAKGPDTEQTERVRQRHARSYTG